MRYISKADVKACLPDDWDTKAQSALKKVQDVYDADPENKAGRSKAIDGNALWSDLRELFKKLSNNKCWYCESIIKRTSMPIDHFRPKSGVKECPEHGGYWWLAYDWENYRLCCTYCNSFGSEKTRGVAGGKGTEFPLWNENQRATCPTSDCSEEQPLLLDPFIKADTSLLWFEPSGNVMPHPRRCKDMAGLPYKRAETSIRIYNLLEDDLKEQRGALCTQIEKKARNADKYFTKYSGGDSTALEAYEENLTFLSEAVEKGAEYSKAAIHTLMHIRTECLTAETILEECVGG